MDSNSELITTDIDVFDCTPVPSSFSMEVVAPSDAVKAVVYATGHAEKPLIFTKVSFKQ